MNEKSLAGKPKRKLKDKPVLAKIAIPVAEKTQIPPMSMIAMIKRSKNAGISLFVF